MRILRLTVAYDGTDFVGWQRQATGVSVQGLLESALTRLTGAAVVVTGAGRTDAGVHALGQVASARVSTDRPSTELQRALNGLLPEAVRVVALEDAAPDFHARYGARAKRYVYRLVTGDVCSPFVRRYAWHVTHPLEIAAMSEALVTLLGTHDFAAFQATGSRVRDTTRTMYEASLEETRPGALWPRGFRLCETLRRTAVASTEAVSPVASELTLVLRGDGFLRHMVRNIVGTLVEIGRGRWPPERMAAVLASRDRRLAGPTAPPQGLFLVEVEY